MNILPDIDDKLITSWQDEHANTWLVTHVTPRQEITDISRNHSRSVLLDKKINRAKPQGDLSRHLTDSQRRGLCLCCMSGAEEHICCHTQSEYPMSLAIAHHHQHR